MKICFLFQMKFFKKESWTVAKKDLGLFTIIQNFVISPTEPK